MASASVEPVVSMRPCTGGGEVAAELRADVAGAPVAAPLKRQRVDPPYESDTDLMHQRMSNDLDAYGESWLGSSEGPQSSGGSPANPWDWVDVSSDCDSQSTSGSENAGTELSDLPCGWAAEYYEETGHQAVVASKCLDESAPVVSFSADLKQMLDPIATKMALEMLLDSAYVAGGKRPNHIGSQAKATGRLFKEQVTNSRRMRGADKWEFKDTQGRQSHIVWEEVNQGAQHQAAMGCRGMSRCYGHVQLRTKGPMPEGPKL